MYVPLFRYYSLRPSRGGVLLALGVVLGVLVVLGVVLLSTRAEAQPAMSWDLPDGWYRVCTSDAEAEHVVVQCGDGRCLYSRVVEAERLRTACDYPEGPFESFQDDSKIELVEGRREAPPGWYRDAGGRVFQVTFDLRRRLYLGGGYVPTLIEGADGAANRLSIERSASTQASPSACSTASASSCSA